MTATPPRPPRRLAHRLSAAFVRTAEPGFYCDGHGLNLRVDPSGARQWGATGWSFGAGPGCSG